MEKLLEVINKWNQFWIAILGLAICNISNALEVVPFVEELMNRKDFFSGFLNGCFAGSKLVGVVVFAYDLFIYGSKKN